MTDTRFGIVVGIDFSDASDLALAEAFRLTRSRAEAEVHVVHVVTPDELARADGTSDIERQSSALRALPPRIWDHIDAVSDQLAHELPSIALSVHVRLGHPSEALRQVAVDYDADVLVVGTHGRRGLPRLVLGSVAEDLVRTARCPVYVARPKDFRGLRPSDRVEAAPPPEVEPRTTTVHGIESTRLASWTPGRPTGMRIV